MKIVKAVVILVLAGVGYYLLTLPSVVSNWEIVNETDEAVRCFVIDVEGEKTITKDVDGRSSAWVCVGKGDDGEALAERRYIIVAVDEEGGIVYQHEMRGGGHTVVVRKDGGEEEGRRD